MFGFNLSWILNPSLLKADLGPIFYLGPETLMPLASILAAVLGFLLIFGRAIIKGVKQLFGKGNPAAGVTAYIEPEEEDEGKPANG